MTFRCSHRLRRVAGLLSLVLAAPLSAQDDPKPRIERSRTTLALLIDQKFDAFVAAGDDNMKSKFSADAARQLWSQITFQVGAYKSEESARLATREGLDTVIFELRFERGLVQLRLVTNASGQMTGLFVDKVEAQFEYEAPSYVVLEKTYDRPTRVVADDKFPLNAVFTTPVGQPPFPGVVLVHGSGPHDVDQTIGPNKPFRDIALGLASRGIIVLRYEKRTRAYPRAYRPEEWTPDRETLDDALAAIKTLRAYNLVDPDRVFVAGHSLGAFMAPFMGEKDAKLAGVIMMAANARPPLTLVEEQLRYIALLDDVVDDREAATIDATRKAVMSVRAGKPEGTILGWPAAYWAAFEKLDPIAVALRTQTPMFLLQGERDYQVTLEDLDLWKLRLNQRGNVDYRSYKRLNHLFMSGWGKGGSNPQEYTEPDHVHRDVIADLADWILARSATPASKPPGDAAATTAAPADPAKQPDAPPPAPQPKPEDPSAPPTRKDKPDGAFN